jgi:Fe-S oxidoreductase
MFAQLITEKKIVPSKSIKKKVVYHDPCTLGRQNNIYDEPRAVLKSIPELELLEIDNFTRKDSVCCGAGGGGLWLDWQKGERMSDIRVKQAAETGAEILAVACPYCLIMFEDSVKTMNLNLKVRDISELLADSI